MRAIAWPRPDLLELGWAALAVCCLALMILSPSWETIPFHVIWISLTLLYGFRVWGLATTGAVLGVVAICTGASILTDAFDGLQLWGELFEVPLMSAMFLAMVWHARRRTQALATAKALADERASLLEQEERLLHDVSHELRTPVTIARGHLELLQRRLDGGAPELDVAFDELARMERIVERVLLLAQAERADWLVRGPIPLVSFLEDVLMRWAGIAPRAWRLGEIVDVTVTADETWIRAALDALLENAVEHTDAYGQITLSARGDGDSVVISVEDNGFGIPPSQIEHVFQRFARADESRSRRAGGSGLGLAIVAAIAGAHDGLCTASSGDGITVFELRLPLHHAWRGSREEPPGPLPAAERAAVAGSASIGG
jgi:two-component system, OmpR family, sensor kinase